MTNALNSGYQQARKADQWVVASMTALAAVCLVISAFGFVNANLSRALEARWVHTTATVLSGGSRRVRVAYATAEGARTVEIDRAGNRLCPSPPVGYRGCGSISAGLEFELVYDPQEPGHAMSAEVVDTAHWMRVGEFSAAAAVSVGLVDLLFMRRLRRLSRLRRSPGTSRAMRVKDIKLGAARRVYGARIAPQATATLVDAHSGATVRIRSFPSEMVGTVQPGDTVDVFGSSERGGVIAIERPEAWVFARVAR